MATTVGRTKATGRGAKKATAKKATAKKATAKKATAKKAAGRKAPARKVVAKKTAAKQVATKKAPIRKVAAKPRPAKRITPEQALANTRRLLEAKHAHDREAPPWQALEDRHGTVPHAGFQDGQARDHANELHAGESRMEATQGAIGTQGRHNQGKRDQR